MVDVYETHVKRVRQLHGHHQLPAVCYRRAAADRPTRPSVRPRPTTTVQAPTTTVWAPGHGSSERCVGSERRGSAEQRGGRATCRRHRRHSSSRRQSKLPTPSSDYSAPLASLMLLLRSWWLLYFPLCSSPFCRYFFSLLCPSPPLFSPYFSMLLWFPSFEPYTIDCILHCYMCFVRISRSSKLKIFCFSHRLINFESYGTRRLWERGS